ncbi:hypothetical protein JXB27_01635 [Candidatus Woesearchaeota archaeon]|nr:hypothetical protein [Candidatus Woesearchaeota archaeon]
MISLADKIGRALFNLPKKVSLDLKLDENLVYQTYLNQISNGGACTTCKPEHRGIYHLNNQGKSEYYDCSCRGTGLNLKGKIAIMGIHKDALNRLPHIIEKFEKQEKETSKNP